MLHLQVSSMHSTPDSTEIQPRLGQTVAPRSLVPFVLFGLQGRTPPSALPLPVPALGSRLLPGCPPSGAGRELREIFVGRSESSTLVLERHVLAGRCNLCLVSGKSGDRDRCVKVRHGGGATVPRRGEWCG